MYTVWGIPCCKHAHSLFRKWIAPSNRHPASNGTDSPISPLRCETTVRNRFGSAILLAATCALAYALPAAAQGKDTFTPMALDAGFGRMDLTDPSVPPETIIKQFAAKESEFEKALDHYTYRRVVRVQTIDDDNKVYRRVLPGRRRDLRPLRQAHRKSGLRPREHPARHQHVALRFPGHPARATPSSSPPRISLSTTSNT